MTAKEKVLAVYPDAHCEQIVRGTWNVVYGDDPKSPGYGNVGPDAKSENKAWELLASRLDAVPASKPDAPTASPKASEEAPAAAYRKEKERVAEIDNVWESIEVARRMARGHMELSKQLVSVPTASPKASEGAEPSAELDALQTIRDAVLHLDANEGFSNDQVNHILDIIDDNWPDTRVAPAPDPQLDELLVEGIAWWKQGAPNEPGGFTAEGMKKFVNALIEAVENRVPVAPDPRVEEIRNGVEYAESHKLPTVKIATQRMRYLLSKLDGKEQR